MATGGLYPKNLQYYMTKLSGYSRNTVKVLPYKTTQVKPSEIVTVDLPSNSLVDLKSLTWHFKGSTTTTAGFCQYPKNIENVISRVLVNVSGTTFHSTSYYDLINNVMWDLQTGTDLKNRRALYQKAVGTIVAPAANETNTPYKVQNWLGFLGSAKPEYLDTNILGNVQLQIHLNNTNVLVKDGSAANSDFTLNDMYFTMDVVSIDDGNYYASIENRLMSGEVFNIPFDNFYTAQQSNSSSYNQSTRFSLSTGSLNAVLAWFHKENYQTLGTLNGVIDSSDYYTRPATALTDYQFTVNNIQYPQYTVPAEDAFALLMNAMNMSQDTLGGITELIAGSGSTPAAIQSAWTDNFWLCGQRFAHETDEDFRNMSGIPTLGSNSQIEFRTTGTSTANVSMLLCHVTSVLQVSNGRVVAVIA